MKASMKNGIVSTVSCGVCLALVGCASQQPRDTGFISDCSVLTPHPAIPGALFYWNPVIDPREYRAVLVEPVEVHFISHNDESRATPEDIAAFRRFVSDELTAAIGRHTEIVTEPGPHVLRWRLRVTLRLTGPIDTPPHPWPARDYALGTAVIEADAHDSITGELVAAYVSPRNGVEWYTTFFCTSPHAWEAAKTVARNRIAAMSGLFSDRGTCRSNLDVATHSE